MPVGVAGRPGNGAMRLQVADDRFLLVEGVAADRARLFEAGRRMAYQMRDELWGYFGMAVNVVVHADSIDITFDWDNSGAEPVAIGQFRQGVSRRMVGHPSASVDRAVEDQLWRWRQARQRMFNLVERSWLRPIEMRTRPGFNSNEVVQLSWSYTGGYIVNPFTWWLHSPAGWVRGIRDASSDRARAAHGPAMHAYHETVHSYGCLFNPAGVGGSGVCSSETDTRREQTTVDDVDWAFRDHTAIAQRVGYGGWPGCVSYLQSGRVDFPESGPRRAGVEWVVFPTQDELQRGEVVPGSRGAANTACGTTRR